MATGVPILYSTSADVAHSSYSLIQLSDGEAVIPISIGGSAPPFVPMFINGSIGGALGELGQLYIQSQDSSSITVKSTVTTGNSHYFNYLILNSTESGAPGIGPVSLMALLGSGNNYNVGTGTLSAGSELLSCPGHTFGIVIVSRTRIRSSNHGNLSANVVNLLGLPVVEVSSSNASDDCDFSFLILPHPTSTNSSGVTAKVPPLILSGPDATCGSVTLNAGDQTITSTAISASTIFFFFVANKTVEGTDECVYIVSEAPGYVEIQSNVPTSTSTIHWFVVNL